MSRAHRLIVVWMAGALGTAVVFRLHALQSAVMPVCDGAGPSDKTPSPTPPTIDDPRDAILEYLKARYDEVEHRVEYGDVVRGVVYMGAPLVEVEDPRLRRILPDMRFFRTTVHAGGGTAQWEMNLVVSFRRAAGADDIRSCVPATFDSRAHNLLSQFIGVPAPTLEAKREVAFAIGALLAPPTAGGSVRASNGYAYAPRVEIWYGREHWRDIDVFDGWSGKVSGIAISNPAERTTQTVISAF